MTGEVRGIALGARRHIIFEDHHGAGSAVMMQLLNYRYTIFSIGWMLRGPVLGDRQTVPGHARYEAPSYLATLAPDEAVAACAARGWMALSTRAH